MKSGRAIAVLATVVAVCLLLPSVALATPAGWVVSTVYTNYIKAPSQLGISGDRAVWVSGGYNGTVLYTQRLGVETTPTMLAGTLFDIGCVGVSGERVAWTTWDNEHDRHIQVYTRKMGADASAVQITTDARNKTSLVVSGDRLAWLAKDANGYNQVYTYVAGVDATPTQVSWGWSNHDLALSNNRVAWIATQVARDMFGSYLNTRDVLEPTTLTLQSTLRPMDSVQLSGDHLAWRYMNDDGHMHVYGVGLSTAPGIADYSGGTVTTDALAPVISDGHTVWADKSGALYSRREGVDTFGVRIASDAASPAVSWDRIAWSGSANAPGVFTEKRGSESVPISLADTASVWAETAVWGDSVLFWDGTWHGIGQDGFYQLSWAHPDWTPKLVTPWVDIKPNVSSMTVARRRGSASYTIGAVMGDPNGTLLSGKMVYLQLSTNNGASWTTIAKLVTDKNGSVNERLTSTKRTDIYFRYHAIPSAGYNASNSSAILVHVR